MGIAVPLVTAAGLTTAAPVGASGPTITGSGSSYAAVAINQWVAQVEQLYGDNINYSTSSSVIGLNEFAEQQVDLGASEIGYSTNQADYTPPSGYPYQYMPDVAGATCLMYNLQGPTGQVTDLQLDEPTALGIFTGTITNWNDPAIAAQNPGVALPNSPIVVVYRSDASGENFIFSDYFSTLSPNAWNAYTGELSAPSGAAAIWPFPQGGGGTGKYDFTNWVGQSGSDNASNYVASSPYTITYVETAYAKEHSLPCASILNASGAYVQPTAVNDAVALESDVLAPDLEQNLTGVFTSTQSVAYPISAYSYLVSGEGQVPAAKGAVIGRFIKFLACQGQQAAGQLGYSPLPPNLVQDDFDAINRINGAANPGTVDSSNCPNPYVDGQTPLPGEPVVQGSGGTPPAGGSGTPGTGAPGATGAGGSAGTSASSGGAGGPAGATTSSSSRSAGAAGGVGGSAASAAGGSSPSHPGGGAGVTGSVGAVAAGPAAGGGRAGRARALSQSELEPAELLGAVGRLIGGQGPANPMVVWTVGFLALTVIPPVVILLRRRLRTRRPTP